MKNMIVDIMPRLAEIGKIKIGGLGEEKTSAKGNKYRTPEKYDHFKITKTTRDGFGDFEIDKLAHEYLGAEPKEIPIRFLFNDLDLIWQTRYVCYNGKKMVGRGDGETFEALNTTTGEWKEILRPDKQLEPGYKGNDKWKLSGVLSCILDLPSAGVGGLWRFRTTSYNSVSYITSSLMLIASQTGGHIANVPLNLVVEPKQGVDPTGNPVTVYVVSLRFRGTIEELQTKAYKVLEANKRNLLAIEMLEKSARQELETNKTIFDEDGGDQGLEFFPETNKPSKVVEAPVSTEKLTFEAEIVEEDDDNAEIPMDIESYKQIVIADLEALKIKPKQIDEFMTQYCSTDETLMFTASSEDVRKLNITEFLRSIITKSVDMLMKNYGNDLEFAGKINNIPENYEGIVELYKSIQEKTKK